MKKRDWKAVHRAQILENMRSGREILRLEAERDKLRQDVAARSKCADLACSENARLKAETRLIVGRLEEDLAVERRLAEEVYDQAQAVLKSTGIGQCDWQLVTTTLDSWRAQIAAEVAKEGE